MDLSELKMSVHTQQQSLIWSEMTNVRRKLEEENQMLRDQLVDAQLTIQNLKDRLKKKKKNKSSTSWFGSKTKGGSDSATYPKTQKAKISRKNAFDNPLAPGKKTFTNTQLRDGTPGMVVFPKPTLEKQTSQLTLDPALTRHAMVPEFFGKKSSKNSCARDKKVDPARSSSKPKKTMSEKLKEPPQTKLTLPALNERHAMHDQSSFPSSVDPTTPPTKSKQTATEDVHTPPQVDRSRSSAKQKQTANRSTIDKLAQKVLHDYGEDLRHVYSSDPSMECYVDDDDEDLIALR